MIMTCVHAVRFFRPPPILPRSSPPEKNTVREQVTTLNKDVSNRRESSDPKIVCEGFMTTCAVDMADLKSTLSKRQCNEMDASVSERKKENTTTNS